MTICWIVSEIKRDIGRKSQFSNTTFYTGENADERFRAVFFTTRQIPGVSGGVRMLQKDAQPRHRQTDRQTERDLNSGAFIL